MPNQSPYNITVNVKTTYIAEQSDPTEDRYVFAYTINIENQGKVPAKLMTRHWVITDADGNEQEVFGEGVVGEQPYLKPGDHFEYTSGTILDTPLGCMRGHYQLVSDDGTAFEATIPTFTLSQPNILH
jgi:ApaG protein